MTSFIAFFTPYKCHHWDWGFTSLWHLPDLALGNLNALRICQIQSHSKEANWLAGGSFQVFSDLHKVLSLCTEYHSCLQPALQKDCSPSTAHSHDALALPANATLPLGDPCCLPWSPLPPPHWVWHFLILLSPSLFPLRQSPRHKDPLTSSESYSPKDLETALWFLYCKELTFLY